MQLQAGFSFSLFPRFYSRLPWQERLRINSGVEGDGRRFYPRDDWRPLSSTELAVLVDDPARLRGPAEATLSSSQVGVLGIPTHIRAAWWAVVEEAEVLDGKLEGYETFVAMLSEFLRFKHVPLPAHCVFEVVASRPGQRSTRVSFMTGEPAGLGFSEIETAESFGRLLGIINLGDEATHIVLLNLPLRDMRALLAGQEQTASTTMSALDLLTRFFTTLPTYPLVGVRLDSGDGLWLPEGGMVYDGNTQGKKEIDLVLLIRAEGDT
jgi:hypothetical protein